MTNDGFVPGEVRLDVQDRVAVMTIDSPAVRNGITPEMADAIASHCASVAMDKSIGALVLTGANGHFCSGADTRRWDVQSDPSSDEAYGNSTRIYSAVLALAAAEVPTIAAGEGAAVGVGLNLLLATDVRIVARTMRLIAGFTRAGIHPGGGFFTLASRAAGHQATAAMAILDQEVSGEQAARLGLAWEATEPGAALDRAMSLAAVAAKDPELSRRAIRSLRAESGPPGLPLPAAIELERGVQMWSFQRARKQN